MREGNPGHRPLPEPFLVGTKIDQPDAQAALARMPPPATLNEDERQAWDIIVPDLAEVGLLNKLDELALTMMCRQWGRAQAAARVISEFGMFAQGSTGQIVEHPAVGIERTAATTFLRYAEQYALTPVARTRLGMAKLEQVSLAQQIDAQIGKSAMHSNTNADYVDGDSEEIN